MTYPSRICIPKGPIALYTSFCGYVFRMTYIKGIDDSQVSFITLYAAHYLWISERSQGQMYDEVWNLGLDGDEPLYPGEDITRLLIGGK